MPVMKLTTRYGGMVKIGGFKEIFTLDIDNMLNNKAAFVDLSRSELLTLQEMISQLLNANAETEKTNG